MMTLEYRLANHGAGDWPKLAKEARERIVTLELALHQILGHGNITGERARTIAAEALGKPKPQ